MKNSSAILKRLEKIEGTLSELVTPRIVVRVINEDPEAVLDRMVANGQILDAQRDDVLVIRRVIIEPPKQPSSDNLSPDKEDKTLAIQRTN